MRQVGTNRRGPRALERYEDKRDPSATTEPFGSDVAEALAPTWKGSFVVHQHDATRMHWDLRLEIGGTLSSFAVPRGPSLDPDAKHLAVNTEDHPIEYLDFEDVIPEGQYGAGAMIVWDRGSVTYLEHDAETSVKNGKIDFVLAGMKLRGRFALVKLMKGDREWLLFKKKDGQEDAARDLARDAARSVLSGLTVAELPNAPVTAAALATRARAIGAPFREHALTWSRARLSGGGDAGGEGTLSHVALGGVRAFITKDSRGVRVTADDGSPRDVTLYYPELARAAVALPADAFTLDGEIVFFDARAVVTMGALSARLALLATGDTRGAVRDFPATFVAFDVLRVGDADVTGAPLSTRLELLSALVPELGFVRRAPEMAGPATNLVAFARGHALPGVRVRDARAPYSADASFVPAGDAVTAFTVKDHGDGGARELRTARVTNRDKIFFPELGITKGEVVDYYVQVAPFILPYLANRPLVLVRYPDGIHGKSFFQWNVPQTSPSWLRHMEIESDDGRKKHAFLVDDVPSLVHVVNLGAIPLHILAFREESRTACDFFTLDFDVKEAGLARALPILRTLRELLTQAGLSGFPKTSGQTGMHVLVPLGPGHGFDTGRALCEIFGRMLVAAHPRDATMERRTDKREGKVLIDVGQTGPSRTIVSAYALRATPEATVSMPLTWDTALTLDTPARFTLRTAPALAREQGCPMRGLLTETPDLAAVLAKLSAMHS